MSEERQKGFRFGPRDDRGLVASLRLSQVSTLCLTLISVTVITRYSSSSHRYLLAIACLVVGVVLALVRVAGRSIVEWAPEIWMYLQAGISGHRHVVYRFSQGRLVTRTSKTFDGLQFVEFEMGSARIGALYDRSERTISAVLRVESEQFSLLDDQEQMRKVSEWSTLLAALSADRSNVRLKWVVQSVPDTSERYRASIARAMLLAGSNLQCSALDSYLSLCEQLQHGALRTDQLVVVSAYVPRSSRAANAEASSMFGDRVASDFARQVSLVDRRLREMGLDVRGACSKQFLVRLTQQRFDASLARFDTAPPWPSALEERWESIRTDNTWHATYWISEWPKSEVSPGFLLPILRERSLRKSVVLCMAPVRPEKAIRAAERRRTNSVADAALRKRYGFALSSRIRTQHEAVVQREEELAKGHVSFEFSGYVTVSAPSLDELQRDCERVEQACSLSHLEIRRLYGMQRESLLFGLLNSKGCK